MVCRVCNCEKDESKFYTSNKHVCKECIRERVKANRTRKIEYYREYDRKRSSSPERIQKRREYKERLRLEDPEKYDKIFHGIRKKFREKYPEKTKANGIIDDMLRYGKLERPDKCSICGVMCKPQAHHPDYSEPKKIIWVCVKCHSKIHKDLREFERKVLREQLA